MANNGFKFDEAKVQDLELIVDVGDTLSPDGLTHVELSGSGSLLVELQREKETEQKYEGQIGAETAASLLKRAAGFDWERRFPPRPGLPDEAIVQWTLKDRSGAVVTVKAWLRDAEKDRVMAPVLEELRLKVDRLTGGKLFL